MALRIELQNVRVPDPNAPFDRGVTFELYTTEPRTYLVTGQACRTMEVAERIAATIIQEARTGGLIFALEPDKNKYMAVITVLGGMGAATTAAFDRPEDVHEVMELLNRHAREAEPFEIVAPPEW